MSPQTALTDDHRNEVSRSLQAQLVELLALRLQAKQAHWNVTGPNFRPLHLQLDEMVAEYDQWSDTVAERINALRQWPDGQAHVVAQAGELEPLPSGALRDADVVDMVSARVEGVAARARQRATGVGEIDAVSEDLLWTLVDGLEKQLWMLRAQFPTSS